MNAASQQQTKLQSRPNGEAVVVVPRTAIVRQLGVVVLVVVVVVVLLVAVVVIVAVG